MMTEHVGSYYAASANSRAARPRLDGAVDADVCVIGAGFTGLSAALHLAERGYQVVLLEAARVGWGASGRNGGELFNGQRKSQDDLEKMLGVDRARQLWQLGLDAVELVRSRVRNHGIACDLKTGLATVAAKPAHARWLSTYADKLRTDYGYENMRYLDRDETVALINTDRYHGAVIDSGGSHLHPLNLCLGLAGAAEAAGSRIFEQSAATSMSHSSPAIVRTANGQVTAKFVVLACNGYLGGLEPRIAGKTMPINNFMLATEPLPETAARAILSQDVGVSDTKFVVNYWRLSADRRLLFGGGENYSPRFPADIRAFVRRFLLRIYPRLDGLRIDYGWGGTLAITMKRLPHFGRLEPNVFFAQGYSGQGVALANLAGQLIAEALSGTAERFDVMAKLPVPSFPGGTLLRYPGMVLGMFYYSMLDHL